MQQDVAAHTIRILGTNDHVTAFIQQMGQKIELALVIARAGVIVVFALRHRSAQSRAAGAHDVHRVR